MNKELSNNFNYKESIAAIYLSYNGNLKKQWKYTLGLRGELTDYDLKILNVSKQKISDKYVNFFPNLSISKVFSDKYSLNLIYSSQINRPPYQALSPVLIYQDPYTSIQGNSELQPEKKHSLELINRIAKTTLKISYSFTDSPLDAAALPGEQPNSYILKRINLDKRLEYFMSAPLELLKIHV